MSMNILETTSMVTSLLGGGAGFLAACMSLVGSLATCWRYEGGHRAGLGPKGFTALGWGLLIALGELSLEVAVLTCVPV